MPTIAWWNNHRFEISPSVIRGFSNLQVKGTCETTDKTDRQEKYQTFKNTQPAEISLTAHLDARLGCNVWREAIDYVIEARWGKSDYFYVYENGQYAKIFAIKMMLTSAAVSNVVIAPTGKWIAADVALTMKACKVSDNNNLQSSSGGGCGASRERDRYLFGITAQSVCYITSPLLLQAPVRRAACGEKRLTNSVNLL